MISTWSIPPHPIYGQQIPAVLFWTGLDRSKPRDQLAAWWWNRELSKPHRRSLFEGQAQDKWQNWSNQRDSYWHLKSSNGSNLINSKAEKIILGKVESSSKSNTKDQQISSKDQQIEKLTNLLDQQQRLALQDKKLLEEYKAENDNLKALKMPSQETEFKHLDNQYKDEVNALKEKLENLQ